MLIPNCDIAMIMDAKAKKREFPGLRVDFIVRRAKGGKFGTRQWMHPVFYIINENGEKVDVLKETLIYGDCPEPFHVEICPSAWGSELFFRRILQYIGLLEVAGFYPLSDECIVRNIQCGISEKPQDIPFNALHRAAYERTMAKKQLQREQEQEEKDAAKKRREESLKYYMASIKNQFDKLLNNMGIFRLAGALRSLFRLIDKENFSRYALMCNGTLRESKYTKEMVELKRATEKVMRYSPKLAEFSDDYEKSRDLIYEVADKLGAEFGNWMLECILDLKEQKWHSGWAYDELKEHLERIAQP